MAAGSNGIAGDNLFVEAVHALPKLHKVSRVDVAEIDDACRAASWEECESSGTFRLAAWN